VRSWPNHFILASGHPFTHDRVVSETERFQVVEKTGWAGDVAEDLDPVRVENASVRMIGLWGTDAVPHRRGLRSPRSELLRKLL
jgi:hypothetical protein